MSLVFAALIQLVAILCAAGIMFAGMMRTTGANSDDKRSALMVFAAGTIFAGLVAASHWVGW